MRKNCNSCVHFKSTGLYSGDCKLNDQPTHFNNVCRKYEKNKDLESRLAEMEKRMAGKWGK